MLSTRDSPESGDCAAAETAVRRGSATRRSAGNRAVGADDVLESAAAVKGAMCGGDCAAAEPTVRRGSVTRRSAGHRAVGVDAALESAVAVKGGKSAGPDTGGADAGAGGADAVTGAEGADTVTRAAVTSEGREDDAAGGGGSPRAGYGRGRESRSNAVTVSSMRTDAESSASLWGVGGAAPRYAK